MSRFNPRNRDQNQYGGQDYGGGGGYNQNMPYQSDMGRQQMMNPWQAGMMPRDGGMQAGRSSEAALAFNILNQVLASDSPPIMNTGQNQRGVFQDRQSRDFQSRDFQSRDFGVKSRLEDRRRGRSPDVSNKNRKNRRRRKRPSRSRSPQRRDKRDSVEHEKKPIRDRLGKGNKADKSDAKRSRSPSQEHSPESKRKKTDKDSSEVLDQNPEMVEFERRLCPGRDGKCLAYMAKFEDDPHPTCARCRGKFCDETSKCKHCTNLEGDIADQYAKLLQRRRHKKEQKRASTAAKAAANEKDVSKTDRMSKERDSKSRSVSKSRERDDWQSSSEDKHKDDQKHSNKTKGTEEHSDKENEEQLVKHLKCHICEIDFFDSIKSFQEHKNSKDHQLLFDIYNQRNDAVLKLMRADSKLHTCRERERMGFCNKDTLSTKCVKCDCLVGVSFKHHKKTIEHELVDNHILRQCCDMTFAERTDFEEHILSLPHFRNQKDPKKTDEEEKVVMAHTDEEEEAFKVMKDYKENIRLVLDSPEDFPEYDSEKPLGMEYIHQKRRYNCTICKKSFPSFNDLALCHCRSLGHYLKLLTHLQMKVKVQEDQEREKKMAALEEARKEKREKAEDFDKAEKDKGNEDIEAEEDLGENMPPLDEGLLVDVGDGLLEDNKDAEDEEQETEEHSNADANNDDVRDEIQVSEAEEKEEPFDEEMQSDVAEDEDNVEDSEPNDEEMPEVENEEIQEERTNSSDQEVQEEETQGEVEEEEEVTGEEANVEEEEEEETDKIKEEDTTKKKEKNETKDEDEEEEEEEEKSPAKPKTRARRGRSRVARHF